jgi:hypothetical protein
MAGHANSIFTKIDPFLLTFSHWKEEERCLLYGTQQVRFRGSKSPHPKEKVLYGFQADALHFTQKLGSRLPLMRLRIEKSKILR